MPRRLQGVRIVSFESRRRSEMATLIEKQGGVALSAPALEEAKLVDQREAIAFAGTLERGECDILVLLTGVGSRWLLDVLSEELGQARCHELISAIPLICRGPKPVHALKERGLTAAAVAAEPNTWRELLPILSTWPELRGKRVWVQEYGSPAADLTTALEEMGAEVSSLPIYAWTLPADTTPLRRALTSIAAGEVDVALFTAAQQVEHLHQLADEMGLWDAVHEQLQKHTVVASIGPVTTEALGRRGLSADLHPEHPKMGHLVGAVGRNWPIAKTRS